MKKYLSLLFVCFLAFPAFANPLAFLLTPLTCAHSVTPKVPGWLRYDNRPKKVVTEFTYDYTDDRVSQKVYAPGNPTATVSTYIGTVYEEKGTERIKYIYAGSQRVAQISSTQGTRYFTNDHLGSAALMTDTIGKQVQSMSYLPFGGTFQTTGSKTTNWRYTGQRQDDSTGLYYYNARYYDPTIGRFLTPDSIVQSPYDPQFLNRYAYCRNNPINLVDPTGQRTDEYGHPITIPLDWTNADWMNPGPLPPPPSSGSTSSNSSMGGGGGFGFSNGMGPLSSMGQFLGTADQRNDYMRAVASVREAAERRAEQARQAAYQKNIEDHYRMVGEPGLQHDPIIEQIIMIGYSLPGLIRGGYAAVFGEEGAVLLGKGTEETVTVQRWMSKAELEATESSGLLRGGREGTHYVGEALNSDPLRARQRLALEQTPEVRVTMEVPGSSLSPPHNVPPKYDMPGGGVQRTATGKVPVRILRVD